MLTISKKNGATSTAGKVAKKGEKGRLELYAQSEGDESYRVKFADIGNYGRIRWEADFGELSGDELDGMIASLMALRSGATENTYVEFVIPEAIEEPETEAEEVEAADESEDEDVPAEALEAGDEDTEQLEA